MGQQWLLVVATVTALTAQAIVAESNQNVQAAGSKPNIVFLLADDQGWNNSGLNNHMLIGDHTRGLVKEGIKFNRHYVFKFCSPTRSSLMSGRWPIHVNQENSATEQRFAGIPLNMTTMSEKMSAAGYICHHFGKWHIGQATMAHTPKGRGFNTSLSFFNFGEDHFTQVRGGQAMNMRDGDIIQPENWWGSHEELRQAHFDNIQGVDLWNHTLPAYGQNGTYGGYSFTDAAVDAITNHDQSLPFFMFCAFQNMHPPLQVPQAYINKYPTSQRMTIYGMATFLDESVGNVTAALKASGMWSNTLIVYSADNGGYLGNGGDSSPYRGGKFSDFEGGTRVPAFASGGLIASRMQGTETDEMMHIADWYSTFCFLAGIDATDKRAAWAGLPPIDSKNLWPVLSGSNSSSPHNYIVLSANHGNGTYGIQYFVGGEAVVTKQYKLITGDMHIGPFGDGSKFPACSSMSGPWSKAHPGVPCTTRLPQSQSGYLYDILSDPSETNNLASKHQDVVEELSKLLERVRPSVYAPYRGDIEQAAQDQVRKNRGYWGPWLPDPVPWPPII